jgi:hypothetical protein
MGLLPKIEQSRLWVDAVFALPHQPFGRCNSMRQRNGG